MAFYCTKKIPTKNLQQKSRPIRRVHDLLDLCAGDQLDVGVGGAVAGANVGANTRAQRHLGRVGLPAAQSAHSGRLRAPCSRLCRNSRRHVRRAAPAVGPTWVILGIRLIGG